MQPHDITIHIDGHQLAAVCLNPGAPGEPVILLHGVTSSISMWQVTPVEDILNLGPCYSLSLPGHYPAVAPAAFRRTPLTGEILVDLLYRAIRELVGERPVTLIGHSTGGFSVLALAADHPDLARRVISVSGFAHGQWTGILGSYQRAVQLGWPGEAYYKTLFRLSSLTPGTYRQATRYFAADWRAVFANPGLPQAIACSYPNYRRIDLDALLPYFRDMPNIDSLPRLANIQAPTLILTGDQDPIVPPSESYAIAKRIRGAELAVIQGAGHLPFLERPEDYHRRLSAWLASAGAHETRRTERYDRILS